MHMRGKVLIGALAVVALTAAVIPDAPVDGTKSTVTAEFKQMSVPVAAPFKKFTGSVHYDPKRTDTVRAHLEIDMSSFDIGDDDYNAEVRKKEWFDSSTYPVAIFQASSITPAGTNKFQAAGELSLKGKTLPLVVPVTLVSAGGFDTFEGSVPISRSKYRIGDPKWEDTVADEVLIKFHIVAPAVR
ncbi:MAG: YceI family protein [Nevskia sp.]|nr:YceI family protein [Nevskia sp.]